MIDDGEVECVVAPGRTVIGRENYVPGDVLRLSPSDAAFFRSTGHLLQADGSQQLQLSTGPMPPVAPVDNATAPKFVNRPFS